jgi:RNA polymerase sigma-70 factor (family 1)
LDELLHHTDLALFARIAEGDEGAFRLFFHRYNELMYPFVLSLVKSEADAREVMQEVFLKLWVQRGTLTAVDNPGGWLRTVLTNGAYDFLRQQARYEMRLSKFEALQAPEEDNFWQQLDAREARKLVQEALRLLPLRRRQIFQLNKMEGFNRREIAEQLQISENTVRNQLVEAVAFVQNYLRKNSVTILVGFWMFW